MDVNINVQSEIEEIIARAMREYSEAKGMDLTADDVSSIMTEEPVVESTHEEIPINSESVLVEETSSRFSSAIWYDNIQSKEIILAGLGGIGSYVAFLLARMNPARIVLYDDDRVESANLSGQLYSANDIGYSKCDCVTRLLQDFACYWSTVSINQRFDRTSEAAKIMICGFDNMEARKLYFEKWHDFVRNLPENERKECLFIDGRLAAEEFQVFCITGNDSYNIDKYVSKFLFSDAAAEETVCSYKQTTFMANMIGSVMVNLFVNFCANECNPLIPRDIPFFTTYSAETMYFKVLA